MSLITRGDVTAVSLLSSRMSLANVVAGSPLDAIGHLRHEHSTSWYSRNGRAVVTFRLEPARG